MLFDVLLIILLLILILCVITVIRYFNINIKLVREEFAKLDLRVEVLEEKGKK